MTSSRLYPIQLHLEFIESFIENARYLQYPSLILSEFQEKRLMDHRTSTYSAKRFQAKVTGRHAITLPAEFCRALGIEVGDTVEFEVGGGWATFKRSGDEPDESIRGILRDNSRT